MRFVMFDKGGRHAPGVIGAAGMVIDVSEAVPERGSLLDIIDLGPEGMARVRAIVEKVGAPRYPLAEVRLLAPIPAPRRNIICIDKNYRDDAMDSRQSRFGASAGKDAIPDYPIVFSKAATTVVGPGHPVPATSDPTNSADYEAELALVIGRMCRHTSKAEAYDCIFGYTIVNDVTSRDLQQRHKQWFLGKNLDEFCPMGPWLVTADEVGDPTKLRVTAHINGELRQDAVVKDLIFDIPALIETISGIMTLRPGDIIATGTPAGVGAGFDPPKFLKAGDHMRIEITGLGVLENPVA